jgi:hypothetical protein
MAIMSLIMAAPLQGIKTALTINYDLILHWCQKISLLNFNLKLKKYQIFDQTPFLSLKQLNLYKVPSSFF